MKTIKLPIFLADNDSTYITKAQALQSPMIRTAFNAAMAGTKQIDIRADLRTKFPNQLDSWFQQSAVISGMGMAKADKELGVKHRIFGSKDNFNKLRAGLITKEEYTARRLLPLYVIGEAANTGNRKYNFDPIKLEVTFKPHQGKAIHIKLPDMRKSYRKLLT